jgi:hypothetical protein
VAIKKAARDMLRQVDAGALAEVESAEQDDSTKAQLMRKQREGLRKLQEELGHTLGDR